MQKERKLYEEKSINPIIKYGIQYPYNKNVGSRPRTL